MDQQVSLPRIKNTSVENLRSSPPENDYIRRIDNVRNKYSNSDNKSGIMLPKNRPYYVGSNDNLKRYHPINFVDRNR